VEPRFGGVEARSEDRGGLSHEDEKKRRWVGLTAKTNLLCFFSSSLRVQNLLIFLILLFVSVGARASLAT
jgi:hypothetical protein